ncbi:MAG: pyrroloquinoline quinone-dependent dehydrogenase [Gammaproteobacteria bacterium]|nr:pyrroloquinoline quinone-dependent dehydrogenase [Gammaproteobacteria bacterium]
MTLMFFRGSRFFPAAVHLVLLLICVTDAAAQGWMHYGGDIGGSRFSQLREINRDNVADLELAWTYRTGAVDENPHLEQFIDFQATPILLPEEAGGHLIVCTPFTKVIALDPATGEERWTFEPKFNKTPYAGRFKCRGLSQWRDPEAQADERCATRLFLPLPDMSLMAIDARDGELCPDFGTGGVVDVRPLIEAAVPAATVIGTQLLSPAGLVRDTVVVTTTSNKFKSASSINGAVRGFDARTGKLRWTFDPLVRVAAEGLEPTPQNVGGANVWVMLSADEERDLIFLPTASPAPNFWGLHRPGDNRYANSIVALRGSTGEVVWHFQIVHHDVWDRDVPSQPIVVDIRRDGETIPAVIQLSKTGMAFVFHRETGEPLLPIEERPVPTDGIPGEQLSPTQPFTVKPPPLVRQGITPDDAWGATWFDRNACRQKIESLRHGSMFNPPSFEGSVLYPQIGGGMNWGGGAFDPQRNLLITPVSQIPYFVRLIPQDQVDPEQAAKPHAGAPMQGPGYIGDTDYAVEHGPLFSPSMTPCTSPPWNKLVAVDMARGEIRWDIPFGVLDKVIPLPVPLLPPLKWGVPSAGGPIITAGGVVFIGATADSRFRAFDIDTGEELWQEMLPTSAMATPMTYEIDGRQFVVIAAGGHSWYYAHGIDDYVLAYALPE